MKEGDLLERDLIDELSAYCPRIGEPKAPTNLQLFRGPSTDSSETVVITAQDPVKAEQAILVVKKENGELRPRIHRLRVNAAGRVGYSTPAALKTIGFYFEGP